jgi:drug/metabolite transporter (DMT)-like permease
VAYATPLAVFYIFLWASAYVPSKIASTQANPHWFLVFRFGAAGLLLAAIALLTRRPFPRTPRDIGLCALYGILANGAYLGLTYLALKHLSSGMGAIIASTTPLALALVAPKLLGERLGFWKAVGLVLGFAGVVWIVLARSGTGTAALTDVALAGAGVCASVASTIVFKRSGFGTNPRFDLFALNAIALLAAGLVLVPVAYFTVGTGPIVITRELVYAFAYLVVIISIGASLIWFRLLAMGEASRVSAFFYLTPAFGLVLSAILLHEPITPQDAVGLVAIAAGIAIVQRG